MPRYKPHIVRCPREGCHGNKGWYSQIPPHKGPKQCPYCKGYLPGFKRGPRKPNSPAVPVNLDVTVEQEG